MWAKQRPRESNPPYGSIFSGTFNLGLRNDSAKDGKFAETLVIYDT